MAATDNYTDGLGLQVFDQGLCNLLCQALLYLQARGKAVDQASQFREHDDVPTREITNGCMTEEGSEMMFAMGIDRYLPDDDQFVVTLAAIGECLENSRGVLLITAGPVRPGTCHAPRRFPQALS